MKKLFYILLSIGLVLGCTRDELEERVDREESESAGKVLVQFNVSLPELTPQTKALGDTPAGDLDNIYLAIFGRSGYLKEYVETSITPAATNGNIGENTNRYTITAILTLSENSERHIHFIGNGPDHLDYGQENEIIPSLLSPAGKGGYWQYMVLPGIKGARDEDDNFLTVTGGDGNTYYKPHSETAAYFQDVALIRNFAKVVVEDLPGCNFTTRSFTVVNVPTQGTMAPYYSEGFVKDYQLKGYLDLQNAGYPGLLPLNTTFNENVPSASAFTNPDGSTAVVAAGNSFFLYERPVPNDQQKPTTVIIYGHFTDPDPSDGDESGDYYYKVDLMDDQGYYPIYRNFKYRIQIEKILRPGADSPEDALRSMGSGDISADVATQSLTEISDGTSEILVSYMSRTIIRKYPYTEGNVTEQLTLLYKYIPDVNADSNNDGEADWNNNYLTDGTPTTANPVLITLQGGLAEPIIDSFEVGDADDENGFRKITITTTDPNDHLRTQYLRVSGTHADSQGKKTTLFRNVTYSMISRQPLWVACVPKRVQRNQGESVEVDITIPKNLPPSMFPLVFYLESDKMSITPDNSYSNNNLPVNSGPSITGSGESTFHFVRTVSEAEYSGLSAASATQNVTIPCYFKTNMASSACTVYVKDEVGFFEANSDDFGNYGMKTFTDLAFPSGVPSYAPKAFPFTFKMDRTDNLPDKVYLKFAGSARPVAGSGLTLINDASDPHNGWYWYSPASTTNTFLMYGNRYEPTVQLATTNDSGRAEVWIEADEYEPAHLRYPFVPATGLTLSPTSVTLSLNGGKYNQTAQLTATLTPSNATDELTWTSSNTSVATVDANGLVTAVARGTATITARDENGHSATCTVRVKERTWHAASYTITLTTSANYDKDSFITALQNVVFTNAEGTYDYWNRSYSKSMGARTNVGSWLYPRYDYSSGYYTVTAPAESDDNYIDSRIVGVSQTYNGNQAVSYASGSTPLTGESNNSWGTTNTNLITSETTGYNQVVVTHSCTNESEYNNRNRVASVTVYYGYYSYD